MKDPQKAFWKALLLTHLLMIGLSQMYPAANFLLIIFSGAEVVMSYSLMLQNEVRGIERRAQSLYPIGAGLLTLLPEGLTGLFGIIITIEGFLIAVSFVVIQIQSISKTS